MGPGWATPYNVIVVARNRPITTPALLVAIERFQVKIARDNAVDSVVGPGSINATSNQLKVDVAVLAVALTLVLALALRAILLPAAAVILNLLVVGAAFGVVQLLFGGSNPPLGGPGYLDPVTIISVFTVAFGVSMTYTTVLLMRTRESASPASPAAMLYSPACAIRRRPLPVRRS
jgi:hypothetical protein